MPPKTLPSIGCPENSSCANLHTAWTVWLSTFHWHYFATLTFKDPRSEASAQRAFGAYLRSIREQSYCSSVGYFCGYEFGGAGRLHLHALLYVPTPQTVAIPGARTTPRAAVCCETMWHLWFGRFGRAKVEAYDRKRGAAGYVSKYVTKRLAYYDIDNMVPWA